MTKSGVAENWVVAPTFLLFLNFLIIFKKLVQPHSFCHRITQRNEINLLSTLGMGIVDSEKIFQQFSFIHYQHHRWITGHYKSIYAQSTYRNLK